MSKLHLTLLLTFLSFNIIISQVPRETRAVWITTNFKLDWPPNSFDETVQKTKLREIFINLKNKHFNTVYFQVRSNGTVMYKSEIEPFSPYFTGTVDLPPSYDPLQLALDLGKEFNIEVHAWINMVRCFSGSDERILLNSKHVRNKHSDWTVRVMSENGTLAYWLNPGISQVQDYLADLMVELTSKYDVDGIQLDFFRYPDKNFDDQKYFKSNGLNVSLNDWRRNNLTTILRKFKEKANPLNPYLKVGVTPIGIRNNLPGASGWEGYSSVFQDTERWLKEELVDYLVPQIYWNFNKNPKFDVLAKDWVEKSHNKNIILGLAAYKPEVKTELKEMIEFGRSIGSAGISFFRYENIAGLDDNYFNDIAFPTNMPWKVSNSKYQPEDFLCTFEELSSDEVVLNWDNNHAIKNPNQIWYYVLFDNTNKKSIAKIISLDKRSAKLKFANPSKLAYNYNLGKIDRLWNEVNLSNPIWVKVPFLNELKKSSFVSTRPVLFRQNSSVGYLAIYSDSVQKVTLEIISKENLIKQKLTDLVIGQNILEIRENLKLLSSIRITFENDGKIEELNFH